MMADGPNSRNPLVKSPQQWFVYGVLAVVIVTIGQIKKRKRDHKI